MIIKALDLEKAKKISKTVFKISDNKYLQTRSY